MITRATPTPSTSPAAFRSQPDSWLDRLTRHPLLQSFRKLLGLAKPVYLETDFSPEAWGIERTSHI